MPSSISNTPPQASLAGTRSAAILRSWPAQVALAIAGSLVVAVCARASAPVPFSPVPVSLSNFGVLLVGLLLGSRTGFAAVLLFLLEGSAGLPVFSNGSLGLFGPTGGYLMAYPAVAFLAGWVWERGSKSFLRALAASTLAEFLLFAGGIGWLMIAFHAPLRQAANWGLYPFLIAEIAKVAAASGIATRFRRKLN